jgi:hypothetical protein
LWNAHPCGYVAQELEAVITPATVHEEEAHDLLDPAYGWFTERFGTADLQEVKALLKERKG